MELITSPDKDLKTNPYPVPIKLKEGWQCDNCHEIYKTKDEAYYCCPP